MASIAEKTGRRPGERLSNFNVTCGLLRQYLKEKGGLGDLGIGMAARPPVDGRGRTETLTTMNLLPGIKAVEADEQPESSQDRASDRKKTPVPSMELFAQRTGLVPVHTDKKPDLNREPLATAGQMTIFYGGKVVVFDNFPAEKARELMTMARKGCPDGAQVFQVDKVSAVPPRAPLRPSCPSPAQQAPAAATFLVSTSESKPGAASPAVVTQEEQAKERQPASSDLPIARRVSLHRFLEKRKGRINSKAPYQLNDPTGASPSASASSAKSEDSQPWLGLGQTSSKPGDRKR